MSSSNRVRLAYIEELVPGETPVAGNFREFRYTSESLTGTPETTQSQSIRSDRLSSGQVVTGLTLGGDINTELAPDQAIYDIIEGAMFQEFVSTAAVVVDLTIDTVAGTITRALGQWDTDPTPVQVGDLLTLGAFVNSANNTQVMVAEIVSTTVIRIVGAATLVDEVGSGTQYNIADKSEIGLDKKYYSIEKAFLDLTSKAINYRGMVVSNLSLNLSYGEIVSSNFSFQGLGYEPVDIATDFMTDGRVIDPAATTNQMNGSVDLSFLADGSDLLFTGTDFCIQSIEIGLNNNLTPQNCVGVIGAKDQTEGTAEVTFTITSYLSNDNWQFLKRKLDQQSFGIGFMIKNNDGFYGFYLPAIQVSGDDPQSTGINSDVILTMTGTAKVGTNGEKTFRIFKG